MNMMDWETMGIIAISGIAACTIILSLGIVAWVIVRGFGGGGRKRNREEEREETQMIQEIHHGLGKMEQRVEALETLLLESDRKGRRSDFDEELRKS